MMPWLMRRHTLVAAWGASLPARTLVKSGIADPLFVLASTPHLPPWCSAIGRVATCVRTARHALNHAGRE